jgi:hypothetical protein
VHLPNDCCAKLLKKQGRAPRVLIPDKLRSYAAAKREIMPVSSIGNIKALTTGRRIASTNATTTADYEEVQVAPTGAAVSVYP